MLVKIQLKPDYRAPSGQNVRNEAVSMNFDINIQMKYNIYK